MDKVAGSGNDEFYTPVYAVKPIVKYIKPYSTVWCPFDNEKSIFVRYLIDNGFKVINTHIEDGFDFFEQEVPEGTDYIISNPPYSLKTEVLERLFKLNVPFAMLLGIVGIFASQKRFDMFKDNDFEVLYMNRRVAYFNNFDEQIPSKNPPFSSAYFCSGILPKQICFEEIDKKRFYILMYIVHKSK